MRSSDLYVIEGIDGTGKSTLTNQLYDEIRNGYRFAKEPYKKRKTAARGKQNSVSDLFYFMYDRQVHIETFEENIKNLPPKPTICDRYYPSTIAYQTVAISDELGYPRDDVRNFVRTIAKWNVPEPKKIFYLDLPVIQALDRINVPDRYERASFLREVQKEYERLISEDPQKYVVMDARESESDLAEKVKSEID